MPKKPTAANKRAQRSRASPRTLERYDKMWQAYLVRPTTNHVVKKVGVSWETAKRAIEDGFPRYGLAALQDRLEKEREHTAMEVDALTEARENLTESVRIASSRLGLMLNQLSKVENAFRPGELDRMTGDVQAMYLDRASRIAERLTRVRALLAGAPTSRTQVDVQHTHRVDTMSEAEISALLAEAQRETVQGTARVENGERSALKWQSAQLRKHSTDRPLLPARCST